MSALPLPPLEYEPPDEPLPQPPRRRWRKVVAWAAAAIGILVVIVVVGIAVLLHNPRFHAYMLRIAQQKATAALGSELRVRDFSLHWSGMSPAIDLYDVVVSGAPPYGDWQTSLLISGWEGMLSGGSEQQAPWAFSDDCPDPDPQFRYVMRAFVPRP